jgi:hypothetical protein
MHQNELKNIQVKESLDVAELNQHYDDLARLYTQMQYQIDNISQQLREKKNLIPSVSKGGN